MNISIRWSVRKDFDSIMRIERLTRNDINEDQMIKLMRQRDIISMTAFDNNDENGEDEVVGFILYRLKKTSIKILRISVTHANTERGIERAMINKLKSKLHADRRSKMSISVPEDRLDELLVLKANGFIGRQEYDRIEMEYSVDDGARVIERIMAGDVRVL